MAACSFSPLYHLPPTTPHPHSDPIFFSVRIFSWCRQNAFLLPFWLCVWYIGGPASVSVSVSVRIPIWHPKKVHKILMRRQRSRQRLRPHKHAHVLCTSQRERGDGLPFTCAASLLSFRVCVCMCRWAEEKESKKARGKTLKLMREKEKQTLEKRRCLRVCMCVSGLHRYWWASRSAIVAQEESDREPGRAREQQQRQDVRE